MVAAKLRRGYSLATASLDANSCKHFGLHVLLFCLFASITSAVNLQSRVCLVLQNGLSWLPIPSGAADRLRQVRIPKLQSLWLACCVDLLRSLEDIISTSLIRVCAWRDRIACHGCHFHARQQTVYGKVPCQQLQSSALSRAVVLSVAASTT